MRVRRAPTIRSTTRRGRSTPVVLGTASAAVLLAVGVACDGRSASLPSIERPPTPSTIGPAPPAPPSAGRRPGQPVMGGEGWRVVSSRSVQGVLIVEVETEGIRGGPDVAARILQPALARHVEALVYFRRRGEGLADTRVQWTRAGGYVTLALR